MFGWNIGTMSTGAKFLYGIFISAVIGAAFWYLYNRVQKNETSHRKKADKKKYNQNYWYRAEFSVPADYFQGGRIWLNLDSVHRDGDVYVNGTKVGSMVGFFQRGRFDVTTLVKPDGKNALAVLAHIMVRPTAKGADGKWNFNVSSPSLLCSGGWDWMPSVPGYNTGILKDVYLTHTGDVSLIDPWIRSDLPNLTEANAAAKANGLADIVARGSQWQEQLLAMGFTVILSIVATTLIAFALDAVLGMRPATEVERQGLDVTEHGEEGYIL